MTLSVQKLSASLQSVCLCWTNRLCVASLGPVNGRNTCGLQKTYLLSGSPATIRSPFDSHPEKETVSPASPHTPSALSGPFFPFLRRLRALKLGRDTRRGVSIAELCHLWGCIKPLNWCVLHSEWSLFGNLARPRANRLHFLFLTGSRIQEPPKECHFFLLCASRLRAPVLWTCWHCIWCRNKTGPKKAFASGRAWSPDPSLSEAHPGQVAGGSDDPAEGAEIGLLWGAGRSLPPAPQPPAPSPQATSVWSLCLIPSVFHKLITQK